MRRQREEGKKEGKRSKAAVEKEEGEEKGENEQIREKKGGIKVTLYMCESD